MRYNHLEMLPEEAFVKVGKSIKLYGKGGGNNTTTGITQTSNIPDYAEPYVMNMLGATQKQLFNMDKNGDITGFQKYNPYSKNAQDYVAGFSPMQQQSFQGAANLRTPGQYGQATDLAGASGLGSLGMAGKLANTGSNFAQQATNPNSVQQYMNPYLQSSLDPQLDAMRRQYGITGAQQQGAATQQGAFGGSREALMASENNRAMNSGMNSAITQGYNTAFNNAQQMQQFGANLGLQGNQAALAGLGQAGQAAGQLGQLGGQQFNNQKDIIGLQNQYGGQQQQNQQQMLNQSIQDYATAQQYPMMQLGMMSNMLRGLPMQGMTTQQYQSAPNAFSQGIGALGTGYALSNAFGGPPKAEGGVIKPYAKGGIASYDMGGAIKSELYDYSPEKLNEVIQSTESETIRNLARSILKDKTGMAGGGIIAFADGTKKTVGDDAREQIEANRLGLIKPLAAAADVAQLPMAAIMNLGGEGIEQIANYGGRAVNAITGKPTLRTDYESPSFGATPFYDKFVRGKENAATPKPAVVAPAQAAVTKEYEPEIQVPAQTAKTARQEVKPQASPTASPTATPQASPTATPQTTEEGILSALPKAAQDYLNAKPVEQTTAEIARQQRQDREAFTGPDTATADYRKSIMDQKANAKDEAERLQQMRLAEFFSVWGSTPGSTLVAGMQAAQKTIPSLIKDKEDQKKANAEADKIIYSLDHASRLEKMGDFEAASKIKSEQAKASQSWGEHWLRTGEADARNKTQLQAGREQNISQEKQTAARNASEERRTNITSGDADTYKNIKLVEVAQGNYEKVLNNNEAVKSNKNSDYSKAKADVDRFSSVESAKDPNSLMGKKLIDAKENLAKAEKELSARQRNAENHLSSMQKKLGFDAGNSTSEKDPFGIR